MNGPGAKRWWLPFEVRPLTLLVGSAVVLSVVVAVVTVALVTARMLRQRALAAAATSASVPLPPANVPVTGTLALQDGTLTVQLWTIDRAPLPPGMPVTLTLTTPAGPLRFAAESRGALEVLRVDYPRAGLLPYQLQVGGQRFEGVLRQAPGSPTTPIEVKVGARAVQVTTDKRPALVVQPRDVRGNVSNLPVEVVVEGPDGGRQVLELPIEHQLAWSWLPVPPQVGSLKVAAVSGEARAEREEIDLLPGPPAQGRVALVRPAAPASGRDPWAFTVTKVRDALGNQVLDGTGLELVGSGPGIDVSLTRPVVLGEVPLAFPAYPEVGGYRLQAVAATAAFASDVFELEATPQLEIAEVPLQRTADGLSIGPVVDVLGALPDDGTPVEIRVLGAAGELLYQDVQPLAQGWLQWQPPPLARTPHRVEVRLAGARAELLWSAP